ncbi:hypothetical protein MRX96_043728 [Rhipicephalus microplus]
MASAENTGFFQPFPVQPPTRTKFDKVSEWPAWMQDFDKYRFASGLSVRTGEAQVCTLMYKIGRHGRNIFRIFELSEEQSKDYEVVKKRFDAYFVGTRNLVYGSACFHRRLQAAGESVDQYVTVLHTLADRCDYGVMKERMILDRFVVELRDSKLSEALQMDATLNLKTALSRARTKKAVQQQQQQHDLHSSAYHQATSLEVDAVHREACGWAEPQRVKIDVRKCAACGRARHWKSSCPAKGAICYGFQRREHFAVVCAQRQDFTNATESASEDADSGHSRTTRSAEQQARLSSHPTGLVWAAGADPSADVLSAAVQGPSSTYSGALGVVAV